MREIPDPVRRGKWLFQRAMNSDSERFTRLWLALLLETIAKYRMNPSDLEIETIELESLLWDMGLPTFPQLQEEWERANVPIA